MRTLSDFGGCLIGKFSITSQVKVVQHRIE